jgi:hypothetical protein
MCSAFKVSTTSKEISEGIATFDASSIASVVEGATNPPYASKSGICKCYVNFNGTSDQYEPESSMLFMA